LSSEPYDIAWSPTARRALTKLPEKVGTAAVEFLYAQVAANPHRAGSALRLHLEGLHSARRGEYRITYAIDDQKHVVHVVTIEHRADVYRRRR
jgi:mRNA interferase RelE/StbE